jgi:hypothetical protein
MTYSPNPLHYLLTYGAYLILAVWGLVQARFWEEAELERRAFLWIWVLVVALLVYAPLNAQRRFVEGVHVPLVILATIGLYEIVLPRVRETRWFEALARRPGFTVSGLTRFLSVLFVCIVSLSSVFLYLSAVLTTTLLQPYPFFRPNDELAAMDWLGQNVPGEDVVFSSYYTGAWLPYRAGTRAYIGQYYETNRFLEKLDETELFFNAQTGDEARIEFLRAQNIPFVFFGRAERETGAFDPFQVPYLKPMFKNADAAIFQVQIP